MHLLAHLSNHLLPDSKLSDHRHTQTDRVSYAYIYIYIYGINMTLIPRIKSYVSIPLFQITQPWSHSPSWVICMNLGLETSLCSHETNPFVVQPYEPISLIVMPHRLLNCRKPSKPASLRPWHAHNHHTMDSSPNSSQREQNYSLPIVRPTHVITILRTPRLLVANGN